MKRSLKKGHIFILFYLSYACIYVARLNFSIASPALIDAGALNEVQLGFIGSAFSIIYACGRLVNGVLGDSLAPRLMIVMGLLGTGAANMLVGTLPAYTLILVLWCINAFAQSMIWSAILRSMTGIYGISEADKKTPILTSCVSVGNILGILLNSWFISALGVRAAFLVPGALTVISGLASLYMLPTAGEREKTKRQPLQFAVLFKDRSIRGMILPSMFHGVLKENISLWMAVYFLSKYTIDLEQSALYMLLIPTVGLAARLVFPLCYKLSGRRENLLSVICFVFCAVLSAALFAGPEKPAAAALYLSLIFAFISIINTSMNSVFPLHFAARNMVSSVSGLTDFITYVGASVSSAIYGFWIADGKFAAMFLSWAALSVLTAVLLLTQHPLRNEYT